ncbi:MAG: HAD family hydrolase, partial [Bryobacteraceae bacterium]
MIPPFPAYLFDIDGTLLDSAVDICGAVSEVLTTTERPGVPDDFLRGYIGRHLLELFGDLFPSCPPERIDEMIRDYRRIYLERGHRATRVYPGVAEGLAWLGGRKSTAT